MIPPAAVAISTAPAIVLPPVSPSLTNFAQPIEPEAAYHAKIVKGKLSTTETQLRRPCGCGGDSAMLLPKLILGSRRGIRAAASAMDRGFTRLTLA
jgi:hypothetical protein